MGENTKISWCDATFNPWIGCTKVSDGCTNCYAEAQNSFRKWNGGVWGKGTPRKRTSVANWRRPLSWNSVAAEAGASMLRRPRVFCSSLADVFDSEVDPAWRADLFALIKATTQLDWQLLTKRPHNIAKMLPADWGDGWPNVWLGTTVEDQKAADLRVPVLLEVPARVHFLSVEPMIGPVDLGRWMGTENCHACNVRFWPDSVRAPWLRSVDFEGDDERMCPACGALEGETGTVGPIGSELDDEPRLDWAICGGESGSKARPMELEWARSLKAQCEAGGAAFFFKQTGSVITGSAVDHGYDPARWPEDL